MKEQTKYKLLKELPGIKVGEVKPRTDWTSLFFLLYNDDTNGIEEAINQGWLEEVKEERIVINRIWKAVYPHNGYRFDKGSQTGISLTPEQIKAIEEVLNKPEEGIKITQVSSGVTIANLPYIENKAWVDASKIHPKPPEVFTAGQVISAIRYSRMRPRYESAEYTFEIWHKTNKKS